MTTGIWENIQEISVNIDEDVIIARQVAKTRAEEIGFSLLDQTKIATAVSELARNMMIHAGGGKVSVFIESDKDGIKVVFEDNGPGIPDIEQAMESGFSTAGSLGLGLNGAKVLSDAFAITSKMNKGTTVEYIKRI